MELRYANADDLRSALDRVQSLYAGNLVLKIEERGKLVRFSLKVRSSKEAGAHLSASGRRTVSACWHAHRDLFGALFDIKPQARVSSMLARYNGKPDFLERFPSTYYRNAGSLLSPVFYGDLCECSEYASESSRLRVATGDDYLRFGYFRPDDLSSISFASGESDAVTGITYSRMISKEHARRIASEWHGGQSSALYAFSSSGAMIAGLASEIASDFIMLRSSGQYGAEEIEQESKALRALYAYAYANDPDSEEHAASYARLDHD